MARYDIFKAGVSKCQNLIINIKVQLKDLPYKYQIPTNSLLTVYENALESIIENQFDAEQNVSIEEGVKSLVSLYALLNIMYDTNEERIDIKSESNMKKTELKHIIEEEIQKILSENDEYIVDPSNMTDEQYDSFVNLKTLVNEILPTILDNEEAELYADRYGLTRDYDGTYVTVKDNLGCGGQGSDALEALKNWSSEFVYAFEDQLNEISTTASVPGYQTPNFLTRSGKTNSKTYNVLGYKDVPAKKLNTKPLSEVAYKEYKNDATKTQKAKVQEAINQINGQLYRLERAVNQNLKLKNESSISHTAFNESSKLRLNKIMERLNKLQQKIRNFGE